MSSRGVGCHAESEVMSQTVRRRKPKLGHDRCFFFKVRQGIYRSTEEMSDKISIVMLKRKAQHEPEPQTDTEIKQQEMKCTAISLVE